MITPVIPAQAGIHTAPTRPAPIITPHTRIECDDTTRAAQIQAEINFNRWQTVRVELSFVALSAIAIIVVVGVIVLATLKG